MDTGCINCGVDIVGGFIAEKKAKAIAELMNHYFLERRLDILDADCNGDGKHLFRVFEIPEDEHINIKYG